MNYFITTLTVSGLLGTALMAGTFFAFSNFIMQALARVAPERGIETMQQINITVLNPWFLGSFMGTAVLGIILTALAGWRWDEPNSPFLVAGGILYVIGTFGITATCNVPLNNKLKTLDATNSVTTDFWKYYLKRWLFWNHIRTLAATIATLAFALGI